MGRSAIFLTVNSFVSRPLKTSMSPEAAKTSPGTTALANSALMVAANDPFVVLDDFRLLAGLRFVFLAIVTLLPGTQNGRFGSPFILSEWDCGRSPAWSHLETS